MATKIEVGQILVDRQSGKASLVTSVEGAEAQVVAGFEEKWSVLQRG